MLDRDADVDQQFRHVFSLLCLGSQFKWNRIKLMLSK